MSGLDATFLYLEDRSAHMHVGGVMVFEGPAPEYRDVVALIASRLDRVPRYRQRVVFPRLSVGRPVWVDDADFDLGYHVRHTALPRPGREEQLRNLAGRLLSQRLDRDKPLWEFWLVDGLEGGRFGVIAKTHHCMIDGISGVDITGMILDPTRETTVVAAPPWTPRPAPDPWTLATRSLVAGAVRPLSVARAALDESAAMRQSLLQIVGGLRPLVGLSRMGLAPATSLNRPIGPHRRLEMVTLDLDDVKRVRAALGGTVNDVLLAVVTGGLRALLESRGEELPATLRAMVPVSIRSPEARGTLGNLVTSIFCPLPIREPDPLARLATIRREMQGLKESRHAMGALALSRLGELAPAMLAAQASRVETFTRFMNVVITNVPGPQAPLYLLGKQLRSWTPVVPLAKLQTIGVALLSYNGRIGVGLLGDADRARDLPVLADAIPAALGELVASSGATPAAGS